MSISPFFRSLRSGYQAEIDDLATDSEGKNVLKQRLAQRRKELGFLLQMLELSPEMVAVVFHQAFTFQLPAAMQHLLRHESEDLPEWDTIADTITVAPWAQELLALILQQPQGAWFMSVAAGLEYLYHHGGAGQGAAQSDDDTDADQDDDDEFLDEEEKEARARDEAGADWLASQGFDRKE